MPELPDVTIYAEAIERHAKGKRLERVLLANPFVLRSVELPVSAVEGRALAGARRKGKRIVLDFGDELYAVIHLMIAGRLRWRERGAKAPGKILLATFAFESGDLQFTEAGSKKRASLHIVRGADELARMDAGGIEPLEADLAAFAAALGRENHTLKRALTDPRIVAGIGNAYSDEILHRARLPPLQQTMKLDDAGMKRLHEATIAVLMEWTDRIRSEVGNGFPEKVTAFRPDFAVHGRFGKPCPECGTSVQRIVRAENESNYCPACQTGGKLLRDRALSRLMRDAWPATVEEMEARRRAR